MTNENLIKARECDDDIEYYSKLIKENPNFLSAKIWRGIIRERKQELAKIPVEKEMKGMNLIIFVKIVKKLKKLRRSMEYNGRDM